MSKPGTPQASGRLQILRLRTSLQHPVPGVLPRFADGKTEHHPCPVARAPTQTCWPVAPPLG